MLAVSLKGMAGRKLRTVLTALAVVLGVALIAGTYILTDTINHQFDQIFAQGPAQPYTVVGIAKFGKLSGLAGAAIAVMTLDQAQKATGKVGKLDGIDIQAQKGVSPQALVTRVQQSLPGGVTVRTGAEQAT